MRRWMIPFIVVLAFASIWLLYTWFYLDGTLAATRLYNNFGHWALHQFGDALERQSAGSPDMTPSIVAAFGLELHFSGRSRQAEIGGKRSRRVNASFRLSMPANRSVFATKFKALIRTAQLALLVLAADVSTLCSSMETRSDRAEPISFASGCARTHVPAR